MGKPLKRSPKLQALAMRLYEELGSGNAVARRLDLSPPTVYRMLEDGGVSVPDRTAPKPRRLKVPDGPIADAVLVDYKRGDCWRDIAQRYGVGEFSLRSLIKRRNATRRLHGGQKRMVTVAEADQMVVLYRDEKLTQVQIAAAIGCSQAVVSRILRQRGESNRGRTLPRGGRISIAGGYVAVLVTADDPLAIMRTRTGYVLEHRLVMARSLGRPLESHETVHHINGQRDDNRIENLQLRQGKHGRGARFMCRDCGSHNVEAIKLGEQQK